MEKVKYILASIFEIIKKPFFNLRKIFLSFYVKKSTTLSNKLEFHFNNIIVSFFSCLILAIIIILFLPEKREEKFREIKREAAKDAQTQNSSNDNSSPQRSGGVWGHAQNSLPQITRASQPNLNTSMLILPKGGNAKLEIHAGAHLKIKIVDKFIVSQEAVPVLAKVIEEATTESGLSIPVDSLLYGEASFRAGSERATITFKRISYPTGAIKPILANVVSSDGMIGLEGETHSDGAKNSAGQFITTFVSSFAAGSMQRDLMGNSTGGLQNGVYSAVAETAKNRAQKYGDGLKESREWIEIKAGTICEAIIEQSFQMIESEANHE